jgi:polar amino acid transport system substrate-binding protein
VKQTQRRILRRAGVWLATMMLLALGACASNDGPPPSRGLARIIEHGELRIGTSGDQPPLSMTLQSGELIGLDIALSRVLAQSMGVGATVVQLPFGELLDAIEAGRVDMIMSGMTITPERARRVTFVGPYYTSGKSMLTRSPELAKVELAKDLDSPDLTIAALAGSTSEDFVRKNLPQATLVLTAELDAAIQMVIEDVVDLLIADHETCDFAVLRHPDAGLISPLSTFTIEPMGIAVPPDDPRFAHIIQLFFNALAETGALERARMFWFKDPSWVQGLR